MLVIVLPSKVSAARTVQVSPPSVDRTTPNPGLPMKLSELVLPLPANKVLESVGLTARELMESAGN